MAPEDLADWTRLIGVEDRSDDSQFKKYFSKVGEAAKPV